MNNTPAPVSFPTMMAAALVLGAGVALVSSYDRKAGYTAALIVLGGVAVYRQVPGKFTEFVNTVTANTGAPTPTLPGRAY